MKRRLCRACIASLSDATTPQLLLSDAEGNVHSTPLHKPIRTHVVCPPTVIRGMVPPGRTDQVKILTGIASPRPSSPLCGPVVGGVAVAASLDLQNVVASEFLSWECVSLVRTSGGAAGILVQSAQVNCVHAQ